MNSLGEVLSEPAADVWVAVGACADIPAREGRVVHLFDREIAVFNLGDRFAALDNRCPHKGGPLSDGIVAGAHVVCPLHAWRVNLDTGEVGRPCAAAPPLRTYPTRVERGVVHVALPATPMSPLQEPIR